MNETPLSRPEEPCGSLLMNPHILLVDRDGDTRELYAQYLRGARYEVDDAEDGRVALAKVLGRHYDVIVTETRLPGITGYELAALIRRDAATRETTIIVVTGEGAPVDVERAYRAGADVVLVKPCLPETLLHALQHAHDDLVPHRPDSDSFTVDTSRMFARSRRGEQLLASARHTLTATRAHQRCETTAPPVPPPQLVCPACDRPLVYSKSHLGGVSARHPEQWDYYECPFGCGTF